MIESIITAIICESLFNQRREEFLVILYLGALIHSNLRPKLSPPCGSQAYFQARLLQRLIFLWWRRRDSELKLYLSQEQVEIRRTICAIKCIPSSFTVCYLAAIISKIRLHGQRNSHVVSKERLSDNRNGKSTSKHSQHLDQKSDKVSWWRLIWS